MRYEEFAKDHLPIVTVVGEEMDCRCVFHEDSNPSMRFNAESGLFYCFQGDTKVVTWDGNFPIRDLSGTTQRLLTSAGWRDAPVKSFGVQPIWEVHLRRNGVEKVIETTREHRWFVTSQGNPSGRRSGKDHGKILPPAIGKDRRREYRTHELKPGQRLSTVSIPNGQNTVPSPWGIAHGIVFGDGTVNKRRRSTEVVLWGEKDRQLLPWFPYSRKTPVRGHEATSPNGVLVSNLPSTWKRYPDPSESATYMMGWLAGYFAADGSVTKDGWPSISSASLENMEMVRTIATRLGIKVHKIRSYMRKGRGKVETPLYQMGFSRKTLRPEFFLIREHRERFEAHREVVEREHWVVTEVRATKREEEVYCAVVEGTHDFVLEDYILTGNCHACHAKGNINTLTRHLGLGTIDTSGYKLQEVRDILRRLETPTGRARYLPESSLVRYQIPTRYWEEDRQLSLRVIEQFRLGADPMGEFVTIPMRTANGDLLGVIKRFLSKDADVRYKYPKGMKKSHHLFGAWQVAKVRNAKTVVLTEGSIDAMKVWQAGWPGLAILGSEVSEEQIRVLQGLDVRRVILFFDNDKAGLRCNSHALGFGERTVREHGKSVVKKTYARNRDLRRYFSVERATYKRMGPKDPGAMTSAEIDECLTNTQMYL